MSLLLNDVEKAICKKFHVHHVQFIRNSPPYMGYAGTRNDLAELFDELGFNIGAEIGVQRANYSKVLLEANPKLKLYLVDPYEPFTVHSKEWQMRQYSRAKQRVKDKNAEFVLLPSIEAAKKFEDNSLDFVYIDAMHEFDYVIEDIIEWFPKVKNSGIISGHDYEHYPQCGVPIAVDAFCHAHGIHPYFITAKDPPRSWFFVKP